MYTENQQEIKKDEKKEPVPLKIAGGANFYSMVENPGIILKKTTDQEIRFYEQVFTDQAFTDFRKFIPKYYGQIEKE